MSRISTLIDKSQWPFNIMRDAILVLGSNLNLSWVEYLDELMTTDSLTDEVYRLERILQYLLKEGTPLLKQIKSVVANSNKVGFAIASAEEQSQTFAREMSKIRRKVAKILCETGHTFTEGLGTFYILLDDMFQILEARNASPTEPVMEESLNAIVSGKEKEKAQAIIQHISKTGWEALPLGEREEAILCLCQHLYSLQDFSTASEFLASATDTGVKDPMIYYDYFVIALTVGEFDAAMQGYQIATQSLPMLSLAPADRYTLEKAVEKNRLYTTFHGQNTYERQPVIIKVLNNPPANVRKGIMNSIKLEKHHGIAKIYKFHEMNKIRPSLCMEYLEGPTLEQFVRQNGQMNPEEWLSVSIDITNALAYAHEQGVIHGNLTPSKLVFHEGRIKLVDFGIFPLEKWALPIGHEEIPYLCFIAPELLSSETGPQATSDIYSLAMTLYYMLTGYLPNPMNSEKVHEAIWPVLRRATDINPKKRHQNGGELLADLSSINLKAPPAKAMSIQVQGMKEDIPDESSNTIRLPDGGTVILPEKWKYRDGIIYSPVDNSQMILVPSGIFTRGSKDKQNESPASEIVLDHYLVDKYLITNAQYACFLEYIKKTGDHSNCHPEEPRGKDHTPKGWGTPEYKRYSEYDSSPVICVDFWDAWAYASWARKSLPTETQWEKAARGSDGRKYPWGDDDANEDLANYNNNTIGTTPVGTFPKGASPYGCMDMAGNVWQWCLDNYEPNFYQNAKGKQVCLANTLLHSVRGGAWNTGFQHIRTSCRSCYVATVRHSYVGFRCVRTLQ